MGLIGNIYGFLGFYNHSRGKKDKALELYAKGYEKGITNPNYQMAYGVLLLRSGQFQEAQDIFTKLLIYFPSNKLVKNNGKINLALTYWKLGDIDTAVERLSEVHSRLKNSKTFGTLGYLLLETGNFERALKFNLDAMEYDNTDPVVLDNVAQTHYRMGDIEEAFTYFKRAKEVKDDQADTLYYLGCIYQQKGQTEEAREVLEKALTCNISALSTISKKAIEDKLKEIG